MRRHNALLLTVALVTVACAGDDWRRRPGPDDVVALVPWFSNMRNHIAYQPFTSWCADDRPRCRQPVAGTVPVDGGDPVIAPAALAPTPANIRTLNRRFPNPTPSTAESLERGRDRYEIFCAICHGDQGGGDGPVDGAMNGLVPSLVTPNVRNYSDGYLYAVILRGRGLMKQYGQRLDEEDRWHVVNYLRVLQGTAQ